MKFVVDKYAIDKTQVEYILESDKEYLYLETQIRCVKYWFKVVKMPPNRLVMNWYGMRITHDMRGQCNWVSRVRTSGSTNMYTMIHY